MDARDFAVELQQKIIELQKNGNSLLNIEDLINYLNEEIKVFDSSEDSASNNDIESHKANLQKWIEEHKYFHASELEMFKSVLMTSQNAIRMSFLMNGGASVALLAFLGHLASKDVDKVAIFAESLLPFLFGVLFAGLTSATTYLCQWFYSVNGALWFYNGDRVRSSKLGFKLNIVAVLFAVLSFVGFGWGMWKAYLAFKCL